MPLIQCYGEKMSCHLEISAHINFDPYETERVKRGKAILSSLCTKYGIFYKYCLSELIVDDMDLM